MEAKDFWSLADHTWMERWPKDAEGQMEQAERLALQSELDSMADITISMLESFGIPAFKVGTQGKVLLGFAGLGVEIYVPASRLEEAQMLLAARAAMRNRRSHIWILSRSTKNGCTAPF